MLNLLRVELSKFFRGKAFLIILLVYMISFAGTFIPLSFTGELVLPNIPQSAVNSTELNAIIAELESALVDIDNQFILKQSGEDFISQFYDYSSGQSAIIMIFIIIYIFSDFLGGSLQGTLLSGYTRNQVYVTKLICGILGSWVFYSLAMLLAVFLGAGFYGMPLNGTVLGTTLASLMGQCLASVEFVAVFTAFGFFFGNGWAFLASTLTFGILPSIPLVIAAIQGRDQSFVASFLPSVVSVNGIGSFVSLEQMMVNPKAWTAEFWIAFLAVWVVVTAVSTVWGIRAFAKKQL